MVSKFGRQIVLGLMVATLSAQAYAEEKGELATTSAEAATFHFPDGEITSMIAAYAKASGRKFIVDPGVRGKVSFHSNGDVSLSEAFNVLSESLALNGFTSFDEGDTTIVKAARNAQRDMIPTYTTLPPVKPNRMVTMVLTLKHISAQDVNMRLRILPSKDGEMTPYEPTNQIIISDYSANINRIAEIIRLIDVPNSGVPKASAPARKEKL